MTLLVTSISFASTPDGGWLLINPERNSAYRVNTATKILCEALQSAGTLHDAYARYQDVSGHALAFDVFDAAATKIAARINRSSGRARQSMTVGFTLLPASWFTRIALPFACLVRSWLLIAVAALLLPALVLGLYDRSFSMAIADYRTGLVGLLIVLASVIFHEIGHAASLVKNGRVVGKLGAGVMLIFPAMFTDVLEHTLMSRREKIWLNVSGIYFQIMFAHCVLLAGWMFGIREWMDYALVVYLIALFQLLPLNGQDGVWLISDLLPSHDHLFRVFTQFLSVVVAGAIIIPVAMHVQRHYV